MQPITTTISAVLFDLDNTLFDHDKAEVEALKEVHSLYHQIFSGVSFETFHSKFRVNNDKLWELLVAGEITRWESREERFSRTLSDCGRDTTLAGEMFSAYLSIYIYYHFMIDGTETLIQTLHKNNYRLGIITNGFTTVQENKMDQLGIRDYFTTIVMSEHVGVMKPNPKIFDVALQSIGCEAHECLFVGDSFSSDVKGAVNAGMQAVWFNPSGKPPSNGNDIHYHSITHLKDILTLL